MTSTWPDTYPSPSVLRAETEAMAEAVVEALLRLVPGEEIAGIYGKGSAWKPWDSPVDYVPELSDVDVHVLFADDAGEARL